MVWRTTGDVAEFVAAAGAFLRSRPAAHTVQLSIVDTLERRGGTAFGDGSPLFGWWPATGGAVTGAFLHTPPHPVLLTDVPEPAAADLAATLAAAGRPLSGINTGEQVARAFAAEWLRHTGTSAAVHQRLRLYRLGELAPPDPAPPGRARPGAPADRDLLLAWCEAFGRDVGKPGPVPPAVVDDRIDYGGLTLWEVGGAPVAMAGATRPLAGMVRVAPVYTPEALRRRGYAGAVTAAVSRAACDAGVTDVVLFTDLANPTSNAIYQRLGYRPVDDRVVLSFGA